MKPILAAATVALGLLLLALSLFWVSLFPGTSSWTPEKAEEWAKVKDRLHNLSFIVNSPAGGEPPRRHRDLATAKAEYDKVKERSTQLRAEFNSAYDSPRTTATVLKWAGIAFIALGAVGVLATKDANR